MAWLQAAPCTLSVGATAMNSFSSAVQGPINTATQLLQQGLGASPNSAAQTASAVANATIQSLQQQAQSAASQASGYAQQAQTCISNAVAAANATTTTTTTTPSG